MPRSPHKSMLPTRKQFRDWSSPSKLTLIGCLLTAISLAVYLCIEAAPYLARPIGLAATLLFVCGMGSASLLWRKQRLHAARIAGALGILGTMLVLFVGNPFVNWLSYKQDLAAAQRLYDQGLFRDSVLVLSETLSKQSLSYRQMECLLLIGKAEFGQDNLSEARRRFEELRRLAIRHEADGFEADSLLYLGQIDTKQGHFLHGREKLCKAIRIGTETGDALAHGRALRALARLEAREGRLGESKKLYEEALSVHSGADDHSESENLIGEAHARLGLAGIARRNGETGAAHNYLGEVEDMLDSLPDSIALGTLWVEKAKIILEGPLLNRQQIEESREAASKALYQFERVGNDFGVANSRKILGTVSLLEDKFLAAREHLEAARSIYERHGVRLSLAKASQNLAVAIVNDNGDERRCEQALKYIREAAKIFEVKGRDREAAECKKVMIDILDRCS